MVGLSHLTMFPYMGIREGEEITMATQTRTTDQKARVSLPRTFANATVIIDQISDTEVRIRKARVIPEADLAFLEETRKPLSDRDRDLFLKLLDKPPRANKALRQLLRKSKKHG